MIIIMTLLWGWSSSWSFCGDDHPRDPSVGMIIFMILLWGWSSSWSFCGDDHPHDPSVGWSYYLYLLEQHFFLASMALGCNASRMGYLVEMRKLADRCRNATFEIHLAESETLPQCYRKNGRLWQMSCALCCPHKISIGLLVDMDSAEQHNSARCCFTIP